MVFSHRPAGFADGAALIPVYRRDLIKSLKPNDAWSAADKVAPGRTPVAPAALEQGVQRASAIPWLPRDAWKHSHCFVRPSRNDTRGSHPSRSRARLIDAPVWRGSPGGAGRGFRFALVR